MIGSSKNRKKQPLAVLLAIALLIAACGNGADTETTTTTTAAPAQTTTTADSGATTTAAPEDEFQAQWDALVAAAQEEGELVMITSTNVNAGETPIFERFGEEFGIEIVQASGSSSEMNARVLAERAQGIYEADVTIMGTSGVTGFFEGGALTELEPLLIEPGIFDRSLWYIEEFPWVVTDTEQKYVTEYELRVEPNIFRSFYNSDNVDPETDLNSWWDLVDDPKFAGRIVTSNVAAGDGTGAEQARGWLILGEEFYDRLFRENTPHVVPEGAARQMVDGIARGEWDICILCPGVTADATDAEAQGLPVRQLRKTLAEGAFADLTGHIGIFDQAPNPAAAQLFVNWILSYDGQYAVNELLDPNVDVGVVALRNDIPQLNRADSDWSLITSDEFELQVFGGVSPVEFDEARDIAQAWFEEIFVELGITPG